MIIIFCRILIYILHFIYICIGYKIINYFYRKKLKKLSSNFNDSYLNIKLKKKNIILDIKNISLDKIENLYIQSIILDKIQINYFFSNNNWIYVINTLKININLNNLCSQPIQLKYKNNIKLKNIDNLLIEGKNSIKVTRYKQEKIIIKTTRFYIF